MAPNAQGPPGAPSPGGRGRSKFRGVSWNEAIGKWAANYTVPDGRRVRAGSFADELHAAIAFDIGMVRVWDKKTSMRRINFPWAMVRNVCSMEVHQLLPEQMKAFRRRAIEMSWIEATAEDAADPDAPEDNARWTDPFLPAEDEIKAREMHERGFPSGADLDAEREVRKEERIKRQMDANRQRRTGPMPHFDEAQEREQAQEDLDLLDKRPGSQSEPDLPTPERDLTPEQVQKRKALAEQLTTRRDETYERKKAAEQERIKKAVAAQERRDKMDEGADDA